MSFFDDFDWKSAIKTIAPTVASIFGTPLAGAGVAALLEAIFPADEVQGLSPAEQEKKLAGVLQSGQLTPEQYVALQQADNAFKTRIAELGIDSERIAAGDRDSARKREVEVKDRVPAVLATVAVVGFFIVLGALFFVIPPKDNGDVIYLLIGQVAGAYAMVLAYYFGSSSGSKLKTMVLGDTIRETRNDARIDAKERSL
ncbi:MAG: hypothetical protein IPK79_01170 [Vampirovibrionales bacterium]|nr:hypothetical protein [Vampirovibrionales bacterium]